MSKNQLNPAQRIGGIAAWLMGRLRRGERQHARLELVERVTLAPRQSLTLIEAEGRRILVATSAEGTPAFFPLDDGAHIRTRTPIKQRPRASW